MPGTPTFSARLSRAAALDDTSSNTQHADVSYLVGMRRVYGARREESQVWYEFLRLR